MTADRDPRELPNSYARRVAREAIEDHEQRLHAAPPHPIPAWLYPQPGPLGGGDLVLTPTADELRAVVRTLDTLDLDCRVVRLVMREGSPWLEFDVAIGPSVAEPFPPPDPSRYGVVRFALWRYTLAVYRVGPEGAVEDDPIELPGHFDRLVATAIELLAAYAPTVFTGESGDPGAVFVAKLREALDALAERKP